MTRAAPWLLSAGALLFIGVLASQGVPAVVATLALAGWGLLLVALFHLVPLVLDAAAILVLFDRAAARGSMVSALLARWVGESANSLMPGGQLGGPLKARRGAAAIRRRGKAVVRWRMGTSIIIALASKRRGCSRPNLAGSFSRDRQPRRCDDFR